MHAIEAAVGMPVFADPSAAVDGFDVVAWSDASADLFLIDGDVLVYRLELSSEQAAVLGSWLHEGLQAKEAVSLAEVIDEHRHLIDSGN